MPSVNCNLCGCSRYRTVRQLNVSGVAYTYVDCDSCGLVWLNPQPSISEINAYYSKSYRYNNFLKNPHRRQERLRERLAESCAGRSTGRLLDIGCGFGFLLAQARSAGWEVEGIELSASCRQYAHERFGLVLREALEQCSGLFDVIVLNHSLEHFANPLQVLQSCKKLLAPDGTLVIKVPNFSSFSSSALRQGWGWLSPPAHLYQFTPETLGKIVEAAGFSRVSHYTATGDAALLVPHLAGAVLRLIPESLLIRRIFNGTAYQIGGWLPERINNSIYRILRKPFAGMLAQRDLGSELTMIIGHSMNHSSERDSLSRKCPRFAQHAGVAC